MTNFAIFSREWLTDFTELFQLTNFTIFSETDWQFSRFFLVVDCRNSWFFPPASDWKFSHYFLSCDKSSNFTIYMNFFYLNRSPNFVIFPMTDWWNSWFFTHDFLLFFFPEDQLTDFVIISRYRTTNFAIVFPMTDGRISWFFPLQPEREKNRKGNKGHWANVPRQIGLQSALNKNEIRTAKIMWCIQRKKKFLSTKKLIRNSKLVDPWNS